MSLWSRGYTRLLLLGASPVLTFYGKAKVEKLRNALAAETPTSNWVSYHLAVATQISSIVIFIMFCRTLRTSRAARTIRCNNLVPKSRRLVTTDAASSHAEKDDVPAVSQWAGIGHLPYLELTLPSRYRKMTSPSMSDFLMRVSKPMSLILPHIPSKQLRRSLRRCTTIWSQ